MAKKKRMDMTNEELRADWSIEIGKHLIGRKIVKVRYMDEEEMENMGWYGSAVIIQLDDGHILWPSMDDEGNGPGAIFTNIEKMETLPVCR